MSDEKNKTEVQVRLDGLVDRFLKDEPDDVADWPENAMDRRFWDPEFDWTKAPADKSTDTKGD